MRMKFWPALVAILVSSFALAQDELERDWRWKVSRSIGFATRERAAIYVAEALAASEALMRDRGIQFQLISETGSSFQAFYILPLSEGHPINQAAHRFEETLRGIRLIYSPSALMAGAEGFFSPRDRALGVSHDMLLNGNADTTFCHETVHASHFVARAQGILDPLSPSARVTAPERGLVISPQARGYLSAMSFEELEAHIESMIRTSTLLRTSPLESQLTTLYRDSEETQAIARTLVDLAATVMSHLGQKPAQWVAVPDSPDLWTFILKLPAIRRGFASSTAEITDGVEFKWVVGSTSPGQPPQVSSEALVRLLSQATEIASLVLEPLEQVRASISWMIERADLRDTNVPRVIEAVDHLHAVFDGWKVRSSQTEILREVGAPLCL
jgi:hypothetical protein